MLIDVNDTCSFGGVTFGQTDSFGVEMYFLGITGWDATDSTVQAVQKGTGDGGFATPAWLVPRAFTIDGAIVAPDRPALVAAMDRISGAASINPQNLTVSNGGAVRYVIAQRQGAITRTAETDIYIEFTIQFLAVDPRKFAAALGASTGLPSSSGGLTVPFTVPFSINSAVVTGQCALTNPGNALGSVVLRIDGPVTAPQITHVGTGASIIFASSYSLVAGNWLTIDMDDHTILENDQAGRATFVTSRGWSSFEPGPNVWSFAASSFNFAARLTVTATPAWN